MFTTLKILLEFIGASCWWSNNYGGRYDSIINVLKSTKVEVNAIVSEKRQKANIGETKPVITIIILCSCQRPAVRARSGEIGGLRCGRSADRYADQEGNVCWDAILDGSRGYPAVRLRLQGKTGQTMSSSVRPLKEQFPLFATMLLPVSDCY